MTKALLLISCLFLAQSASHAQVERQLSNRSDQYTNNMWKHIDSAWYTYTGNRGGVSSEANQATGFDYGTSLHDDSTGWHNSSREIHTYDGANRLINNTVQIMVNGSWRNSYGYQNLYDAAGNLLSSNDESWDTLSSSWVYTYMDSFTYDGQNHQLTHMVRNQSSGGNVSLDSMSYDANGNVTVNIYLTWDGAQWVRQYGNFYTYTPGGKQLRNLTMQWSSGSWSNYQLDTTTYDSHNNTQSETSLLWSSGSGIWNTGDQYLYQYDASNNNTFRITNVADSLNTGWKLYETDSMAYDGSGNQVLYLFRSYSGGVVYSSSLRLNTYINNLLITQINSALVSGSWVPNSKYEMTYDANGYRTSELSSTYQAGNWVPTSASYAWYEQVAGINEVKQDIRTCIYPNPAHGQFAISFDAPKEGVATLCLYDLTGKLITTTNTTIQSGSNSITWDAYSLPTGMYIYQLSLPNATGRGKVVME